MLSRKYIYKKITTEDYSLDLAGPMGKSGGIPDGSVVKNLPANAGGSRDAGSIPGEGRSPGVGNLNYHILA